MRSFAIGAVISLMGGSLVMAATINVIPQPSQIIELPGQFTLNGQTTICVDQSDADFNTTAQQLLDLVDARLDAKLQIQAGSEPANSIVLTLKDADATLGNEGYELSVKPESVTVRAATQAGLFYGIQTLRQMLPPQIESRTKVSDVAWTIPCAEIKDSPRYAWRGLMLDVSRHFFDKGEVEHVLDLMALQKLNVFHWHLTDDQGWRIEIKKYPKLTEIGAWRDGIGFKLDPKRSTHYNAAGQYGGFYTQDEIREVVAYAGKLHIMVVPEIEMPGHAMAALAVYPEFSCSKQAIKVGTTAGVMDAIYDAGDDATFTFLDDVLTEVAELFPAPYIHIGGDEVPKGPWKKSADCQARIKAEGLTDENELQSYFIKRVEKIVESKHHRLIGWDEILEGGLAPDATVMSWRGIKGGIAAAQQGHDVVMTPTSNLYLDYSQTHHPQPQRTAGGYLPLERVYSYDPTPAKLTPEQQKHVLGVQGNIWTEYVPNMQQVEYMAFPRSAALAEIAWSATDRKNYPDFLQRLDQYEKRLALLKVNYFIDSAPDEEGSRIGEWTSAQMTNNFSPLKWDAGKAISKNGKYKVTMQYTDGDCQLDIASVALMANGVEVARDTHDGFSGYKDEKNVYFLNLPTFEAGTNYAIVAQVHSHNGTDSNGTVSLKLEP